MLIARGCFTALQIKHTYIGQVLERVRALAFRLLLLIPRKGNLEYCDVASCGGHLPTLLQKRDLDTSSAAEPYKISWRPASAYSYSRGFAKSAHCAFALWWSTRIKLEPKKMLMEWYYARNISWVPRIVHTLQNNELHLVENDTKMALQNERIGKQNECQGRKCFVLLLWQQVQFGVVNYENNKNACKQLCPEIINPYITHSPILNKPVHSWILSRAWQRWRLSFAMCR